MEWNAIHHDLHLSVLAGVGGVLAVVLAAAHPTAHGVLNLRPRCGRGVSKRQKLDRRSLIRSRRGWIKWR